MSNDNVAAENLIEYVTVLIGDQLFGLPISRVQDAALQLVGGQRRGLA